MAFVFAFCVNVSASETIVNQDNIQIVTNLQESFDGEYQSIGTVTLSESEINALTSPESTSKPLLKGTTLAAISTAHWSTKATAESRYAYVQPIIASAGNGPTCTYAYGFIEVYRREDGVKLAGGTNWGYKFYNVPDSGIPVGGPIFTFSYVAYNPREFKLVTNYEFSDGSKQGSKTTRFVEEYEAN